jgi:hypothetical protein
VGEGNDHKALLCCCAWAMLEMQVVEGGKMGLHSRIWARQVKLMDGGNVLRFDPVNSFTYLQTASPLMHGPGLVLLPDCLLTASCFPHVAY